MKPPKSEKNLNEAPHPSIHALGMIAMQWNLAERALEDLIWLYLETDKTTARLVTGRLGNQARCDLLKNLIEVKEIEGTIRSEVLHAIECFDTCRVNRNHLIHGAAESIGADGKFRFKSSRKAKPSEDNLFEVEIEALRECANDIHRARSHLNALHTSLSGFLVMRSALTTDDQADTAAVALQLPALPQRPAKPKTLNPLPPAVSKGTLLQPQP
jgi:hypothetical protein